MRQAIGVDVGGSKILAARVNEKGRVLRHVQIKTPRTWKAFVKNTSAAILEVKGRSKVRLLGLGVPGYVVPPKLVHAPNMRYLNGKNLAKPFQKATGLRVVLLNDVSGFVLSQWALRFKRKPKNLFGVTVGTGVGGGIIIGGKLYRGTKWAGELGRLRMAHPKTGKETELEALIGTKGILRRARAHGLAVSSERELGTLLRKGNRAAKKTLKETAGLLGKQLSNIVHLTDIDHVVIGGGASLLPGFVPQTRAALKKRMFPKRRVRVTKAGFTKEAGAIGAALAVLKPRLLNRNG